ncbi:MAG: HAD family hydrolase [Acidobacteriota bacterium]|nr:HAD family hydrolase [Acidobacteriota bacterium]
MKLILFDIDGTLVRRAGPHHRRALEEAVRQVTGVPATTDGIPLHGMLDPDIIRLMLDAAGIQGDLPGIMEAAENIYDATVPADLSDKTCPGVIELLTRLEASGAVLALVTGNLTRIGWRKLERAGVGRFFRFGAFGEEAETRGGLARIAIEKARRDYEVGRNAAVALVGDTANDVIAARENGIRSIAVRTGVTPAGELEACSPDHIYNDLTEFDFSII